MERIVVKGFSFEPTAQQPAATPAPAAKAAPPAHSRNRSAVVDTVIAEAAGEGSKGMQAVAGVIKNRAEKRGLDPDAVVKERKQFTGYEHPGAGARKAQRDPAIRAEAERIVDGVMTGALPDITGGADHYHADYVKPGWAGGLKKTAKIGQHEFYTSGGAKAEGKPRRTGGAGSGKANWANTATIGDPKDPAWQRDNLTTIEPVKGQKWTVYKPAAAAFNGLISDLAAQGYNVKSSGGFNYRKIRGGNKLSQHAFGTAIDLNAVTNPLGGGKSDLPSNIRELAAKHGLVWGGDFKGRKDPMHFEYAGAVGDNSIDYGTTGSVAQSPSGMARIVVNKDAEIAPDNMPDTFGIKSFDPMASFKQAAAPPTVGGTVGGTAGATATVKPDDPLAAVNAQRIADGKKPLIQIPAAGYEKWKEKWDAEQPGLMSDIGNLLVLGAQMPGHALREIVRALPGGDYIEAGMSKIDEVITGKPTEQLFAEETKAYTDALSKKTQAAREKDWWDSENGQLGDAWSDPRAYLSGIVESLPSSVLTMGPAQLLARGTFKAAVAAGLTKQVASKQAAKTALLAGGVGEGLLAGGSTSEAVRAEMAALPQEVWEQSDSYKALIAEGMTPEDAKATITNDSAAQAGLIAGVTTGMVGGRGDKILTDILSKGLSGGVKKRILKGAAKEAVGEALEETVQSGSEQVATNIGVGNVDPNRELTEGVANAALGGAVTGGIMGGGIGGAAGAVSSDEAAAPTPPADETAEPPPAAGAQTPPAGGPPGGVVTSPAERAGMVAGANLPTRPKGALESALDHGETEAQRQVTQQAVANGAAPPGTRVTIQIPGVDGPEGMTTGVIESYDPNGDPNVKFDDGEVGTVPIAQVSPLAAPAEETPPTAGADVTGMPAGATASPTAGGEAAPTEVGAAEQLTPEQQEVVDLLKWGGVNRDDFDAMSDAEAAATLQKLARQRTVAGSQARPASPVTTGAKPAAAPTAAPAAPPAKKSTTSLQRDVPVRDGELKPTTFPDAGHATLYDLGAARSSVAPKQRGEVDRVTQQAIADKMNISFESAGALVDDYFSRARQAADLGKVVHRVRPDVVKRMQAEHAKEKAKPAKQTGEPAASVPSAAAKPAAGVPPKAPAAASEPVTPLTAKQVREASEKKGISFEELRKQVGATELFYGQWTDEEKQMAAVILSDKPQAKGQPLVVGTIDPKFPFFRRGGRIITMVDIGGVQVPFYISTGAGGKEKVATGKWYPFFGVGKDDGWFNKGAQDQIVDYYNHPLLRDAAQKLDKQWGDIRGRIKEAPPGSDLARFGDKMAKAFPGQLVIDTGPLFAHLPNADNDGTAAKKIGAFIDSLPRGKAPATETTEIPGPPAKLRKKRARTPEEQLSDKLLEIFASTPEEEEAAGNEIADILMKGRVEGGLISYDPEKDNFHYGTKEGDWVFPTPKKTIDPAKGHATIGEDEARARVDDWKATAKAIGAKVDNSKRVIISLFDSSGSWSKPFRDAGYHVVQIDIDHGIDIFEESPAVIQSDIEEALGKDYTVVGVLSACPCTTFAGSGAQHWPTLHDKPNPVEVLKRFGPKAAMHFDTPLAANAWMVHMTGAYVDLFKPQFHVLENPRGRISEMTGLPKPLMVFDPTDFGDSYTKETRLWGSFSTDLPIAPVEPVQGSKMQSKLRGDNPYDKAERSLTPEGFAYAFFMAQDPTARASMSENQDRAAATVQTKPPVAAGFTRTIARNNGPDSIPNRYVDHGIDITLDGQKGDTAKDLVITRGKANKNENMVIVDANGDVVGNGEGKKSSVSLSPRIWRILTNATEQVVIHHNHPIGVSLSEADVSVAALPGVTAIYAHLHNGATSFRMAATAAGRAFLIKGAKLGYHETDHTSRVKRYLDDATKPIIRAMQQAIMDGVTTVEDASPEFHHLSNLALQEAGIVDYDVVGRIAGSPMLAIPGIKEAYDKVVAKHRKALGGTADADRPAGPVRHTADLAVLQGRDGGATTRPSAKRDAGVGAKPAAGPAKPGQKAGGEAAVKPKKPTKAERERAEFMARVSEYYTPGNIVKSYGGTHDRVIAFEPDEHGRWAVVVQHTIKKGDQWVDDPHDTRKRVHGSIPTEKELLKGPVQRAAPAVEARPVSFTQDNPAVKGYSGGEEWLARKQANAEEDMANATRPGPAKSGTYGATTATAGQKSDLYLPVDELLKLPGIMDEHGKRAEGEFQYDNLLKKVKESGYTNENPVFVMVNHKGQAFMNEGNTRIRVAKAVGIERVKAWVNWKNGGEMVDGPWSPAAVAEMEQGPSLEASMPPFKDREVPTSSVQKDGDSPVRISTRFPDLVSKTEDPLVERLTVDTASMKAEPNKGAFQHNMRVVAQYVNMPRGIATRNSDHIARVFKDMVKANLRWLYDQIPPAQRNRTKLWYDGARKITDDWMVRYKLPDHVIAGALAALSPQKDWYQNVSLAERVLDIMTFRSKAPWTNMMGENGYVLFGTKPDKVAMLDLIRGKTLDQIDEQYKGTKHVYAMQAMWVRIYDQTYHDPRHRQVSSEGNFVGDLVDNVAWGSLSEIGKAVAVIRDPSYENVSKRMGKKHKVRNFFNNILAPKAKKGDVTIDTHAVAAALLRALSGGSYEVNHNFGTSPPLEDQDRNWRSMKNVGISGTSGSYGLIADAHRELAAELGILPRELQSITWEAVRGLFTATFKAQAANVEMIDAVWRRVRNGEITAEAARSEILRLAGGIESPSWYRPGARDDGGAEPSTYERTISGVGIRSGPARQLERGAGSGAAGDVPELEAADVSDRLRTPQFERWFKGSKVVDADGNPLRVYHGTTADFSRFDPNESGTNTGHSTANLGFWFSADTGIANMFAGEIPDETTWPRKFTHKAGANLMPVYLKIKNPYVMSAVEFIDMVNGLGDWAYLQDYDADGRAEEMERIQQRYIKQGYDGVHIVGDKLLSERYGADEYEADAWVAFRPNQIKSTANRGTFDPDSEHVLEASVINELLADVRGAVGGAASTLRQPGKWQLKDRIRSLWTGATPAMLGAVYLNYMPDLSPKSVKAFVERYIDQKRAMDTMRNVLHHAADNIVQDWRRYGRAGKDKMQALASLMHDATKAGVDPDDLNDMLEPDYAALKTRFDAMPDAGRDLYRKVRDAYKEQSQAMDQLLLDNVTKAQEIARRAAERERARKEAEIQADPRKTAAEKTAEITRLNAAAAAAEARGHWSARFRVNRLRSMLETRKVKAPYFPLGRFGSYYVAIRDDTGKLVYFGMAESAFQAKQMKAAARTHLQAGDTIKSGKMPSKLNHMTEVIKPTFIAEIEAMLDGIPNANDPGMRAIRDNILDQIWQRHLQSMPDLSVRSRAIHRSMVAGHSDDALRVFANHMFHAAHQMAKLKHAPDMQDTIDEMGLAAKDAPEAEQIQATNIFDEMVQRNNWVMNPTGKAWAQWAATSAFGYYLGASPAAAAVNLAQTPMVGIPIMAGRFGSMSKAASAVARASRNAISNRGMSATEERALNDMVDAGVIDNTQSYDIQGVGEQGAGYNPIRTRVMGALTIMFHKAEVINRRVTGLAAYRLAIEAGENHATAVKTASNIVWKTHFDYANSSRPRHLTTPGMKTIMAMRSYQINMLYRLGRDLYVSFLKPIKGLTGADLVEAKQLRREARYQLAGILGMQALVAGGTAVAGYNTAFFLYGIASTIMATIFGGGDEGDDPFTAQENFEAAIKDIFGPVLSNVLLHGPIGTLTGVDLTSRVGMPDLWFRSPNQDIETGKDMYSYMLSQWVGAPAGIIDQVMRGYDLFAEGNAWRGTETILPKAAKDVLKSYRYLTEGVTTKTGETIISQDDTGWWSVIAQATGFTPAHIAEKWDETSRLKGAEQRIKVTRQAYINGYAMAVKLGDDAGRRDAIAKIREWNKSTYGRTMPIRSTSIASSLRHSAVAAGKRERGDGILIQNEALRRALQAEPVD